MAWVACFLATCNCVASADTARKQADVRGVGQATPAWKARNFLIQVRLLRDRIPSLAAFPFSIPAIGELDELRFERPVTFFVGENGAGKSTLLEAIAVACG